MRKILLLALAAVMAPLSMMAQNPEDYGQRVTVMEEDFSKMTSGEYGNPNMDTDINLDMDEYEYPWWNLKPEYTQKPDWGSGFAYQAGGAVCLDAYYFDEYTHQEAHLNTCLVDVSENGGIAWIQFDARCEQGKTSDGLVVEAAETNDMGPSWDVMGSTLCPTVTDQWQTYTMYFHGGGKTTIFNFYALYERVYIDNVRVFTVKQTVATPQVLKHSDYKGTSFRANWTAVEGADGYLLSVFSADEEGKRVDFLTKQAVAENTFVVEGVESGRTYYYEVQACKGQDVSLPSTVMTVYDMVVPVLKDVTDRTESSYTANWGDVPSADGYYYMAYAKRVAEADGAFAVTSEDFTGVCDAEGNPTGWTKENPSYQTYDEMYIPELYQRGWKATHYAPYTDYICLDAWQYIYNGSDAGLVSPEFDLSKDGGKFSVSLRLAADFNEEYQHYTQCAVALFTWNETRGDYDQTELQYAADKNLTNEWQDCTLSFTKGTDRSVVGVYAVYIPENLYVDDLKITQNYKADDFLIDPFLHERVLGDNKLEVTVPDSRFCKPGQQEIYHNVCAIKTDSNYGFLQSAFCDRELIGLFDSGIESLTVNRPAGTQKSIYTIDGKKVNTPGRGIHIVENKKVLY